MAEALVNRRWFYWLLLVGLALTILFLKLLPLNVQPGRWPGPMWLLTFSYCWVLRRPDYVPTFLLAVLLFLSDLMFMRPPGLLTALSILGLEFLRSRAQYSRDLPFLFEWGLVACVFSALLVSYRLLLAIFVVPQPTLAFEVLQLGVTILFYPVIALISTYILGVRKVAPGEVDQLGHRI